MRAITVEPKKPDSARWEEVPEPDVREGSMLVEAIAVGVCGTDVEIETPRPSPCAYRLAMTATP